MPPFLPFWVGFLGIGKHFADPGMDLWYIYRYDESTADLPWRGDICDKAPRRCCRGGEGLILEKQSDVPMVSTILTDTQRLVRYFGSIIFRADHCNDESRKRKANPPNRNPPPPDEQPPDNAVTFFLYKFSLGDDLNIYVFASAVRAIHGNTSLMINLEYLLFHISKERNCCSNNKTEGVRKMTEAQAKELLSKLTYEEKIKLNDLLKFLEQKRQLLLLPLVSTE